MDDLGFLVADKCILKIKKSLEKERKITLDWGTCNAVIYNINKMEAKLFFKARNQKLVKQLTTIELKFGCQTIWFN